MTNLLPRLCIPDSHRIIRTTDKLVVLDSHTIASGCKFCSIWCEGQPTHIRRVSRQCLVQSKRDWKWFLNGFSGCSPTPARPLGRFFVAVRPGRCLNRLLKATGKRSQPWGVGTPRPPLRGRAVFPSDGKGWKGLGSPQLQGFNPQGNRLRITVGSCALRPFPRFPQALRLLDYLFSFEFNPLIRRG